MKDLPPFGLHFADYAIACTCNATSVIPHEHETDCAALKLFYMVDNLRAKNARLMDALEKVICANGYADAYEIAQSALRKK